MQTFKVGDKVQRMRTSRLEKGTTSKLLERWTGPYTITEVLGPVTYIIKDEQGKIVSGTVHAKDLLKIP